MAPAYMAALTATIISGNWAIYIWAIAVERTVEAALGYYIDGFERAGHIPIVIGMTRDASRIEEILPHRWQPADI